MGKREGSEWQEWLREYQQRVLDEDPQNPVTAHAHIYMAWEYVRGDRIERDFDKAIELFRRAENTEPLIAQFHMAKAKILNGDETFRDELTEGCAAGFGPALYLMGVAAREGLFRKADVDEAVRYFSQAGQNGHIVSEFYAWRFRSKSAWEWFKTLPTALRLTARIIGVRTKDPDDPRTLT